MSAWERLKRRLLGPDAPYVIPSAEGANCFPRLNPPCLCTNNSGDNPRCLRHGSLRDREGR